SGPWPDTYLERSNTPQGQEFGFVAKNIKATQMHKWGQGLNLACNNQNTSPDPILRCILR
ncbi:hypothetical protein, partial [Legionella sp. S2E2]|uniref:hypothetical protein n=1 Tax=Legionella sp. S2E2 TaxID=3402815 RepID=UPI003AF65485